jgi:hypothetical protein
MVLVVASIGYVTWIVVAEGDEIDRAVLRFQGAELRWLVAAVLLEGCSQLAASLMQRRLVGAAGTDLTVRHAVGLVLAQKQRRARCSSPLALVRRHDDIPTDGVGASSHIAS